MLRIAYLSSVYHKNDFIGPAGSYEFSFVSGAPPTRNDNFSLFWPFDQYVWGFLIASAVAVSIALICINKIHATLSNEQPRDTPFKSTHKWRELVRRTLMCFLKFL